MFRVQKFIFFLLLGFSVSGCVSMPQEAPELSAEIGKQIVESRTSHLALLHRYMAEKRERIDAFIAREWIPAFAKNVFKRPAVKAEWQRIVRSDDTAARLEFVVGMGTRLQQKINAKRRELMQPLDEFENQLTARLNEHYDQMLAANNTLTAFLDSAVSVKERQHRILKMMKVDGKLTGYMDKADEIVGKIVAGRDAFEKNKGKIDKIIEQVRHTIGGV